METTQEEKNDFVKRVEKYQLWKKSQQRCQLNYDLLLPKLPVIAGLGYDLFKGNPISEGGRDPGIKSNQIFTTTYADDRFTGEGCYFYSNEVSVTSDLRCDLSSASQTINNMDSYKNTLKVAVEAAGGYEGLVYDASFSASVDYKNTQDSLSSAQTVSTISQAECGLYAMTVRNSAPLSDEFLNDVNLASQTKDWTIFIQDWGTHFIDVVKLGAKAIQKKETSYANSRIMSSLKMDVGVVLSGSYSSVSAGVGVDVATSNSQKNFMSDLHVTSKSYYIGKGPVLNKPNDQDAWAASIRRSYVAPIKYKLKDIPSLFTIKNFPKLKPQDLTEMQKGLRDAVNNLAKSYSSVSSTPELASVLAPVTIIQSTTPDVGALIIATKQDADTPTMKDPTIKATGMKCYFRDGCIQGCALELNTTADPSDTKIIGIMTDAAGTKIVRFPAKEDLVQIDSNYNNIGVVALTLKFSEGSNFNLGTYTDTKTRQSSVRVEGKNLVGLRGQMDSYKVLRTLSFILNTPSLDPKTKKTEVSYSYLAGGDGTGINFNNSLPTTTVDGFLAVKFKTTGGALSSINVVTAQTDPKNFMYVSLTNIVSITVFDNNQYVVGLLLTDVSKKETRYGTTSGTPGAVTNLTPYGYKVYGLYGRYNDNGIARLGFTYRMEA